MRRVVLRPTTMATAVRPPVMIPLALARRIWIAAQGLDRDAPFGAGAEGTRAAVEHLGYEHVFEAYLPPALRQATEAALGRFETFQLAAA